MDNGYIGHDIADNGDVTITVDGDHYTYSGVIPFAEFQRIADESKMAAWSYSDLPTVRGMI